MATAEERKDIKSTQSSAPKKLGTQTETHKDKKIASEAVSFQKNGQWSLNKTATVEVEELEKGVDGKRYSGLGDAHAPFKSGSTIRVHKAVSDSETGKTHGYEVHETDPHGKVKVHSNVPHKHLDSAMGYGKQKARLRMGGDKSTKRHNLYHEAKVEIHRHAGKDSHHMVLKPHGDPHTLNVKE
jgi:hypothetical protein